ncbi:MAG: hypothetical protein R6W76_12060 [Caldilinea sp.]
MHRNQNESMAKKLGFSIAHHFGIVILPGYHTLHACHVSNRSALMQRQPYTAVQQDSHDAEHEFWQRRQKITNGVLPGPFS